MLTIRAVAFKGRPRDREVAARFVVGADGMWSRTAQLVDARTYRSYPAENATYYAYYDGIETNGLWFHFATRSFCTTKFPAFT